MRHAEYMEAVLSLVGRRQAIESSNAIAKLKLPPISKIITSPIIRAKQTAEVLETFLEAHGMVETDSLLSEGDPNIQSHVRRFDEAFKQYFQDRHDGNNNIILVCHSNIIRYFVTR